MSFSSEVKEEASKTKEYDALSELLAFLRLNSSIVFSSKMKIEFNSTNPSVAKRFVSDVKDVFKNVTINLFSKEQAMFNKSQMYVIVIEEANDIVKELKLLSFDNYEELKSELQIKSYLRGAFLINGSINNPEKSHHLEIRCKESKDAVFIQKIMNKFELNAKIGKRRNELIVYIKDSEKIEDFLYIISASRCYFKYNEVLINKKVKGNVKKNINCELFNASKSLDAANNQLNDIALIEKYNIELDQKLKELVSYRKEYIDASLTELVQIYAEDGLAITKSCLNHRFRKLHEIALKIRENEK